MQVPNSEIVITCSFTAMFCELSQLQARSQQLRYWQKTKGPVMQIKGSKGIETIQLEQKIAGIEEARQRIKVMLYQKHTQARVQQIRAQQATSVPVANL